MKRLLILVSIISATSAFGSEALDRYKEVESKVCDNVSKAVAGELMKLASAAAQIEDEQELREASNNAFEFQVIQQKACKVLIEKNLF